MEVRLLYNTGNEKQTNMQIRDDAMAKHRYSAEEIAEWRKKHGSFMYFNRDDANFMVNKPYGYGRSYNWAHPLSWVFAAILAAFIIYMLFFRVPAVPVTR
jgi:uncharacterized membrane protein